MSFLASPKSEMSALTLILAFFLSLQQKFSTDFFFAEFTEESDGEHGRNIPKD
jgi:hypothetical protein